MALYHVAVTGRDRRHLTELGTKLRVVVVGYREEKRGIVVDAFVPAEKIAWLQRQGYGVTRIEKVDGSDRKRQAESRAAVRVRLVRDEDLEAGGFVARLLAKPLAGVRRPRNIYVLGFLFGLGFDTATTIGLLIMATAASLAGVSPPALLALPLAFTAAMTLCDTANGVAMMRMYRTAIHNPQRRLGFNALITGISAVSALFISFITLGGFFNAAFGLEDPVTTWLAGIDLGEAGLLLLACLLAVWGAACVRGRLLASRQGN